MYDVYVYVRQVRLVLERFTSVTEIIRKNEANVTVRK